MQQKTEQNAPKIEEKKVVFENKPFHEEDLRKVWNLFIEELGKNSEQSLKVFMETYNFALEDTNITVFIGNSFIHEEFSKQIKEKLVSFLREQLQNNLIQLTFKVDSSKVQILKDNSGKNAFTELAEKFPILNELKEKFGLD